MERRSLREGDHNHRAEGDNHLAWSVKLIRVLCFRHPHTRRFQALVGHFVPSVGPDLLAALTRRHHARRVTAAIVGTWRALRWLRLCG